MMFDHVVFGVSDYDASRAFFLAALAPLGVTMVSEGPLGIELCGPDRGASLCIRRAPDEAPMHLHLAFVAQRRDQVDAFYEAALRAGGQDNGAPGLRPQYHDNYYGAFVIGPDGHNVEAVCHTPDASMRRVSRGDLFWVEETSSQGDPISHPYLVLQEDFFNRSRVQTIVMCALSTRLKLGSEMGNVLLDEGEGQLPRRSVIVVSQLEAFERRRLGDKIGTLSEDRVGQALAGLMLQQLASGRES